MFGSVFRFFFVYSPVAYARGRVSLLSDWPRWLLLLAVIAGLFLLGWQLRRRWGPLTSRTAAIWALQGAMLALLLLLLWRPALVVSTVVPRQNIAAILLDDSASMGLESPPRLERVKKLFAPGSPVLARLQDRFQVRLYRFSETTTRIPSAQVLAGSGPATRLQEALGEVLSELKGLPLGAVVVVTDGADNASSGDGADRAALAELKARRVPLHAVGVGREHFDRDLQVNDVVVSSSMPAGGIASASVAVHQEGYAGKTVTLEVRENGKLIQTRPISFDQPAQSVTARVNFTPRSQGVKEYTFSLPVEGDEAVRQNNSQSRVIVVEDRKSKLLYVEGEPRWEYKFIRRSVADDPALQLTTLLRTSANKFYRQGVESDKVLETGFPKQEELFPFEGLLLGSIEAGFFSGEEMQAIYDFVSRRGGGLLFLGGRRALADGGYQNTMLADLLPVTLAARSGATFLRREARAELTAHGQDTPMLQLAMDAQKSAARWKALPALGDYQRTGEPKPGAVVLATASAAGERAPAPLLVSQRFGRGRTLLLATGSSWRWQMEMDHKDDSHELFWRQLLRWLVSDTPTPVRVTTGKPLYRDDHRIEIRAEVRDRKFQPIEDATVTATVTAPDGSRHELPLEWAAREEGLFTGRWEASGAGTFAVEAVARRGPDQQEVGRSLAYFQRTEGTLEFYNAQQNRALLTRLAEETGGRYYTLEKAGDLPDEIVYSEGGVTEQNVHELWHLPAVLLLLLGLKGTEWGLRKAWGSV